MRRKKIRVNDMLKKTMKGQLTAVKTVHIRSQSRLNSWSVALSFKPRCSTLRAPLSSGLLLTL